MGCSILNMLFRLDLSLLEVLFVYTIKNGKNDIFSMFANIPSLQLVTSLPDSNKRGGGGQRARVSQGGIGRLDEAPGKGFFS